MNRLSRLLAGITNDVVTEQVESPLGFICMLTAGTGTYTVGTVVVILLSHGILFLMTAGCTLGDSLTGLLAGCFNALACNNFHGVTRCSYSGSRDGCAAIIAGYHNMTIIFTSYGLLISGGMLVGTGIFNGRSNVVVVVTTVVSVLTILIFVTGNIGILFHRLISPASDALIVPAVDMIQHIYFSVFNGLTAYTTNYSNIALSGAGSMLSSNLSALVSRMGTALSFAAVSADTILEVMLCHGNLFSTDNYAACAGSGLDTLLLTGSCLGYFLSLHRLRMTASLTTVGAETVSPGMFLTLSIAALNTANSCIAILGIDPLVTGCRCVAVNLGNIVLLAAVLADLVPFVVALLGAGGRYILHLNLVANSLMSAALATSGALAIFANGMVTADCSTILVLTLAVSTVAFTDNFPGMASLIDYISLVIFTTGNLTCLHAFTVNSAGSLGYSSAFVQFMSMGCFAVAAYAAFCIGFPGMAGCLNIVILTTEFEVEAANEAIVITYGITTLSAGGFHNLGLRIQVVRNVQALCRALGALAVFPGMTSTNELVLYCIFLLAVVTNLVLLQLTILEAGCFDNSLSQFFSFRSVSTGVFASIAYIGSPSIMLTFGIANGAIALLHALIPVVILADSAANGAGVYIPAVGSTLECTFVTDSASPVFMLTFSATDTADAVLCGPIMVGYRGIELTGAYSSITLLADSVGNHITFVDTVRLDGQGCALIILFKLMLIALYIFLAAFCASTAVAQEQPGMFNAAGFVLVIGLFMIAMTSTDAKCSSREGQNADCHDQNQQCS